LPHDTAAALLDMLAAARRAVSRLADDSAEAFSQNSDQQWVVFSQLVLIGEAANRITNEDQTSIPEIPWSPIISMRNRIVHGYDSIDWGIVFHTVQTELPLLIAALERQLQDRGLTTDPRD